MSRRGRLSAVAGILLAVATSRALCQSASSRSQGGATLKTAPAPGPSCLQGGVTAMFYDLLSGQAQYLKDQFPFETSGPGNFLSSAKVTETIVTPQLNFASPELLSAGAAAAELQPWPRSFPANSNGTLGLFQAKVQIPSAGFWTFFVSSSSPLELTISHDGEFYEVLKTGDELEILNATVSGFVHQAQYNLPAGELDLYIEWHQGLPGDVVTSKLLLLEWAYEADPVIVPSPNPPEIFRQIIPARYLRTSCLASPGPTAAAPASSPSAALTTKPLSPPVLQIAIAPSPNASAPQTSSEAGCKASYTVLGSFFQGGYEQAVISLDLTGTQSPPYTVSIYNPSYLLAQNSYNWEITEGSQGYIIGSVNSQFGALTPNTPYTIGATFTSGSSGSNLAPVEVRVAGKPCSLSPS